MDGVSFGRYYALVIGVQDYVHIEPLTTPKSDARAVADILSRRYGFETRLLLNPDYNQLVGELLNMLSSRAPEDNVLIYFAGHGVMQGPEGFWLPREARRNLEGSLPNRVLVGSAGQFTGRSLLVVADSCFGAALAALPEISGPLEYLRGDPATFHKSRGRYVMSAGGETPILDDSGKGTSLFTGALVEVLSGNDRVLTQRGLSEAVRPMVSAASQRLGMRQEPQVAPMRDGLGNEGGKFYFVPVGVSEESPAGTPLAQTEILTKR